MTFEQAKNELMRKFEGYGVTEEMIISAMKDGIVNYDMTVLAVYNGLRMAISSTLAKDKQEYFSVEDVMSITGETREECVERIEEMLKKIEENGGNPDDYAIKTGSKRGTVYFFPNGLK